MPLPTSMPAPDTPATIEAVWDLIPASDSVTPADLDLVPASGPVGSGYALADLAGAAVGAATLAATEAGVVTGASHAPPTVSTDHALADWTAFLTVDGQSPPTWADLSGYYPCRDGRAVQLHCNFPHHAAGVVARLGVEHDRAAVADAVSRWDAFELEDVLRADGMICAAYRDRAEWDDHPHAGATESLPLLEVDRLGDADPRPARPGPASDTDSEGPGDSEPRPLDGLRVVDCSRILAGPVCGRTLAAHGADVLRIGAPDLPSVEGAVIVTGFGKRNAYADLDTEAGRADFESLLAEADVFVDAFRPGSLADRGFSAERAAELRPGIVVVEVCAFDWVGPWAGRRGFDSIVQSTTGIALSQAEVVGSSTPVHLPFQALDFATGYLAAFAAARLVARQRVDGGSWRARLSLLRTRNWLVGQGGPHPFEAGLKPDVGPFLHTVESEFGTLGAVAPVAGRWDLPPSPLGSAPPAWR